MQPNPEPEAMLAALREKAERLEADANRLRDEFAAAGATASSPDGAVTVTLSPTGALEHISFSAKASGHKPEALGPLVMSAVRAAQRQVSAKMTESLAGTFGDPSTMEFIRQFVPEPEPEPAKPGPGEEYGAVLRKRPGRAQQPAEPTERRRGDSGGGILR